MRLDMFVNGVGQDFGTLSARTMVTNSDGVATVVYTAPPSPVGGLFGTCRGSARQLRADRRHRRSASDSRRARPETVTIRLVPPGVILPPASTPTALFTFSPPTASANAPVAFDATSSCAGQVGATGGCVLSNNVLTASAGRSATVRADRAQTVTHTVHARPAPSTSR